MAMAFLGTLGGLGVSILVGRAFRGLLFGVPPADPGTLAGAALVLVGTALVAAWIPARRASRVDAVVSLRAGEAG
jgi:ABC-type antimicrobial peptide transport system permease subunit